MGLISRVSSRTYRFNCKLPLKNGQTKLCRLQLRPKEPKSSFQRSKSPPTKDHERQFEQRTSRTLQRRTNRKNHLRLPKEVHCSRRTNQPRKSQRSNHPHRSPPIQLGYH